MKRLASLLLMALLSFALFADSLGYAGFGLGFGFGKTSYEDSLEIKLTSLEVNIDGVFYLTEERSDVQLGIGVQAGLGIPLSYKLNDNGIEDAPMSGYLSTSFEFAYRINRKAFLEARAGLGVNGTTLSQASLVFDSAVLSATRTQLTEFYIVAGAAWRGLLEDGISIKAGADASFTFEDSVKQKVIGGDRTSVKKLGSLGFDSISFKPYVMLAIALDD